VSPSSTLLALQQEIYTDVFLMESNGPWIARNQMFAGIDSKLLWHMLNLVFCQNEFFFLKTSFEKDRAC